MVFIIRMSIQTVDLVRPYERDFFAIQDQFLACLFLTKGLQWALFEILRLRLNKCIKFTDVNDAVFDEN